MDNLNGDNVEWVGFPSGMSHVFCFAFYVRPPPTGGTIVIQKSLVTALPTPQTFDFSGSVSYNPGGAFSITVPAGATTANESFVRGETGSNPAWTAAETVPDGFQLVGLACTSQTGESSFTYSGNDPNSAAPGNNDQVNITLAAADTVTCTFTNGLAPPPTGSGAINKEIITSDGRPVAPGVLPQAFTYTVTSPANAASTVSLSVQPGNQNAGTGTIPNLDGRHLDGGRESPDAAPRLEVGSGRDGLRHARGVRLKWEPGRRSPSPFPRVAVPSASSPTSSRPPGGWWCGSRPSVGPVHSAPG